MTENLALCLRLDSESKFCFVREAGVEAGQQPVGTEPSLGHGVDEWGEAVSPESGMKRTVGVSTSR